MFAPGQEGSDTSENQGTPKQQHIWKKDQCLSRGQLHSAYRRCPGHLTTLATPAAGSQDLYFSFPQSLEHSPFWGKSRNTSVKRWGSGRRSFPEGQSSAVGISRPSLPRRPPPLGQPFGSAPHASVWNSVGDQFSVPNVGRPFFLPATFREAREPRALRPAEHFPTQSAIGSVVGVGTGPGAFPPRLRLPSRNAGRGRLGWGGAGKAACSAGGGGGGAEGEGGRREGREAWRVSGCTGGPGRPGLAVDGESQKTRLREPSAPARSGARRPTQAGTGRNGFPWMQPARALGFYPPWSALL